MMRKLAVTVVALSLAALGCGSDSGTKTPDASPKLDVAKADVSPGPEVQAIPDAPVGQEVQVPLDTAKLDVSAPDVPQIIDQATPVDQALPIDVPNAVDVQPVDGPKPVDGGAPHLDAQPKVDSGSTVDTRGVDGGAAG
jgi:hypothetical protein